MFFQHTAMRSTRNDAEQQPADIANGTFQESHFGYDFSQVPIQAKHFVKSAASERILIVQDPPQENIFQQDLDLLTTSVIQCSDRRKKQGRPTNKKQGKKSQRDKRPYPMSDPEIGDRFVSFWHDLKQGSRNRLPDWKGRKWLQKTQAEITGSNKGDETWNNTTIWALFVAWMRSKGFVLDEGSEEAEPENPEGGSSDGYPSDDEDQFGGLGAQVVQ
jgi:hypothetical protein